MRTITVEEIEDMEDGKGSARLQGPQRPKGPMYPLLSMVQSPRPGVPRSESTMEDMKNMEAGKRLSTDSGLATPQRPHVPPVLHGSKPAPAPRSVAGAAHGGHESSTVRPHAYLPMTDDALPIDDEDHRGVRDLPVFLQLVSHPQHGRQRPHVVL